MPEDVFKEMQKEGLSTAIIEPADEIKVCPICKSYDTEVEKTVEKYPYFKCNHCQAGYFDTQRRSACTKWHKAVTQRQCQSCQLYNPKIQCQFWNGILPFPEPVMKALKLESIHKKEQSTIKPRRVA